MNVHLLCKRYYTNKDLLSDRFGRLYHLPVQLARLGTDVSVTAIDYRGRGPDSSSALGVTFRTAPAALSRLPGLFFDLCRSIQAARPDILVASGDSHIGYIGLRIARRLGIRFAFDVYDYYPAFPGNRIPGMKVMFRSAVKHADLVFCAGEPLRRTLLAWNRKALLVENGVDRQLFTSKNRKQARQSLNLADEIPLVGYFGSITPTRGPLLIDACRSLRETIPRLHLILAGRVTNVAIDESWISYRGELPQASIPELIGACDVVTVPYAGDTFNRMTGACKIAEYLACGKPVVATRVANHEEIFKDAPGSLCDPDSGDMAHAIRCQLDAPNIVQFPETLDWDYIGRMLYTSLVTIVS